jgi:hypothetical protein
MTEQTAAPRRGRPSTKPATAKNKATVQKKPPIKRTIKDENTMPVLYETITGGGIFFKLKSGNLSVYDEETDAVRGIQYCPQEPSIFKDEQSQGALKGHVIFRNKMLLVERTKPNLLKFLELHPGNAANGGSLFKKVEKEKNTEQEVEREFLVNDAISIVKSRPIDELLPLAMSLNIETNQKNMEIKRELVMQAKRDPRKFLDMLNNPLVNARSSVMQAFDFNILKNNGGAVVWHDTGKMVVAIPVGQSYVEVVTRFVMTDQGASVLSEIERQLEAMA